MRLKALEIQGFKSFPDKTRLSFDSQVTAIVGPNGSGKSNISDALRWVMGEQSNRTLRSAKMEDVIFSGTAKRAQTGYAQVSLILENDDGALSPDTREVMVTRRYYRSGESEYYINKQTVRLRDVNELFMDTGLGRDGYSVIGQGRIDEILSRKSGERREIFEEAAGISRFRYRKEEAERRLAAAADNLTRVNDRIGELELQREPLRVQAEAAKRYLLCRDELRGLETAVWLDALDRLEQTEAKNRADFQEASRQLDEARGQSEKMYADIEAAGEELRRRDVELDALREAVAAAGRRISDNQSNVRLIDGMIQSNNENLSRVRREMAEDDALAENAEKSRSERAARLSQIDIELENNSIKASELQKTVSENAKNAGEAGERAEAVRAAQTIASHEAATRAAEIRALDERAAEAEQRKTELENRRAEARERAANAAAALDDARASLEASEAEAARWAKERDRLRAAAAAAASKAKTASETEARLRMDVNNVTNRLTFLRELEKEYNGFHNSTRTVLRAAAKGALKNVHGAVSRLLRVEDKYVVAVEVALGGAMQNIVVETQEDGRAAIEYLKRNDAGSATFLPLDAIRPSRFNENLTGETGFLGLASELVRCDETYDNIFSYLLGRTVVADNLANAIKLSRKFQNRLRIVTLDGQMMNAGGSMTGGSLAKKTGILSRANEIEQLDRELFTLNTRRTAAEAADRAAREAQEAAASELEDAELRLRLAEDETLTCRGGVERGESVLAALDSARAALETERQTADAGAASLKSRRAELETQLKAAQDEADRLALSVAELFSGQRDIEAKNSALIEELSALRSAAAALDAEKSACARALDELRQSAERRELGRSRREAELSGCMERDNELINERKTAEADGDAAIRDEAALKEKHASLVAGRMELEGRQNTLSRAVKDKNQELTSLEREYARLEEKQSGGVAEEKLLLDRLWDSYGLTRTTARAAAAEVESIPKAKARANRVKSEMQAMGHPNLGAIEEFDRVNTRWEYLTSQRGDAEKAKTELEGVISRLTESMTDLFAERFKLINESFRETFLEIFGGGSAGVYLEDESDILSSGIEIRVQPPGKQVKSISLLSGGERAFVASALYFAIQKVRPTPFCIFDEIDSSLDEVNAFRFAEYMRKMSGKTQFIVITHRRPTMEQADMLYGVTMQQEGVSKVLSLRLDEIEKELGIA